MQARNQLIRGKGNPIGNLDCGLAKPSLFLSDSLEQISFYGLMFEYFTSWLIHGIWSS
jgi:hypothetical protein